MQNKIKLIVIDRLRGHEQTDTGQVKKLVKELKTKGEVHKPIVVDRKTLVILDGHHRVAALRKLGAKRVPVFLIDYKSKDVRVYLRKKDLLMKYIKQVVVNKAVEGQNFPVKTTRHLLKNRPEKINIPLEKLL